VYSVFIAGVLGFSVLGIQSAGLYHSVIHADHGHAAQWSSGVFDQIEKNVAVDSDQSYSICKLLDGLFVGAVASATIFQADLLDFSHSTTLQLVEVGFLVFKVWPYQSHAPPSYTA